MVKRLGFSAVALIVLVLAGPAAAQPREDKNPGHLKMALVNLRAFCSDTGNPEYNRESIQANLKRHLYFADAMAAQGAEFIGFPELSINGYHFSPGMTWLSLDGPEVKTLQEKAAEHGVYLSAGIAEQDADGRRWNTHIVIDPQGQIIARHHKIYLTDEEGYTRAGAEHKVFEVKGLKMGIAICADGSDRRNLQALAANGAKLIYGPHASHVDGTTASWYDFRSDWAGRNGWMAKLKVYAAIHNHAGQFNPDFKPDFKVNNAGWCSGGWFIGPDGQTLAQIPSTHRKSDAKENVLICNVPIAGR